MAGVKRALFEAISTQVQSMGQALDDACMQKIEELDEIQLANLFQELASKTSSSQIRNASAFLLSKARTMLAKGQGKGGTGSVDLSAIASLQLGGRAPLHAKTANMVPHGLAGLAGARGVTIQQASSGGTPSAMKQAVQAMLQRAGIWGVDEAAVEKICELDANSQTQLMQDFKNTTESDPIASPSKWLFSKARTMLVQQQKMNPTPRISPPEDVGEAVEVAELPGIVLDTKCLEKLNELEPEERAALLLQFQQEGADGSIRNPSSWLFAKARSAIVSRVTGGTGGGDKGGGKGAGKNSKTGIDPMMYLAQVGIDNMAQAKLRELSPGDLKSVVSSFQEMRSAGQIQDPSKWLYAKARSIAAKISQEKQALNRAHHMVSASAGTVVPDLPGVMLDDSAVTKLQELEPEERAAIYSEYRQESQTKQINNPSGWIFGRARTKLLDRLTGKSRDQRITTRSSPY